MPLNIMCEYIYITTEGIYQNTLPTRHLILLLFSNLMNNFAEPSLEKLNYNQMSGFGLGLCTIIYGNTPQMS